MRIAAPDHITIQFQSLPHLIQVCIRTTANMRYIDSGNRNAADVLGTWFQTELGANVEELRCQTGFFSADALGLIVPVLTQLRNADRMTRFVIGSNEPGTPAVDVRQLVTLLGLPRANARLGVVCYDAGYYHPKTYHFRRADGSQAAYVGSANFGSSGVGGKHIEAGIILDSSDGDPTAVLDQIAAAVDAWFAAPARPGFENIADNAAVTQLVASGVLLAARPPRQRQGRRAAGPQGGAARPRLNRLVPIPAVPAAPAPSPAPVPVVAAAPAVLPQFAALTQYFPAPFVVDWSIIGPTHAAAALTSTVLPNNAVGLVVRLPRPVIKGILGQGGTASLTIPVDTLPTVRFAVAQARQYLRPWATFELVLRYIGGPAPLSGPPVVTNVLPYGYLPGEKSNHEVRLRIPKQSFNLMQQVRAAALPLPSTGNFAFLEWPTAAAPRFRLTFLDPGSALHGTASGLFAAATAANQLVGDGACYLPPNTSPL